MFPAHTATCPKCNVALAEGDRFCKQCGTEVSGVSRSLVASASGGWTPIDTSASSPWDLVLGRLREVTIGEFDIGREIGRGGMAAVFLAHDMALNRKVAIKVMAPALMMGEGMVQRFRQEAITIANLSHANIVTIHAVRQLADLHFFVMQFVEGQSLETVLRTHGRLSVPVVRAMLHQIGSALAYAHRRGVVHRDIKPGNILLSGDGDALVTDFGIAKVAEGPTQTQTGMVVGTPTYMSPEQCYASDLDGASDQYSLGIVAYQMLTGNVPFSGSAFAIMKGHTNEPVPPIRSVIPEVPAEVDDAILRMLAKKPGDRFATFADALAAMGAGPVSDNHPLRVELIQLAAVEERREQLGELLRTPSSPVPGSRKSRRVDPGHLTPRTPSPATAPVTAIAIAIAPLATDLEVGDSVTLRASVRGTSNPTDLAWSSESPSVVSVHASTGLLTALAPGEAVIVARIGDVEERLSLTIAAPRVASVRIGIPTTDVHVGDVVVMTAQPLDKRGTPLPLAVEWSVVGTAATIDGDGTLHATGTGRAAVSASCEEVYETVVLHVAPARVATIDILAPSDPLEVGHSVTLGVVLRDAHGGVLTDRAVQWQVTDTARARIDAAGVFSALDEGAVRVTAASEGMSSELELVIPPARAATVSIINLPELVRDGDRFTLAYAARDVRGTPVKRAALWRSSNPEVATIDAKGAVFARSAGATDLSVKVDDAKSAVRLVVHATPAAFAAAAGSSLTDLPPASATTVLGALDQAAAEVAPAPVSSPPAKGTAAPDIAAPVATSASVISPDAMASSASASHTSGADTATNRGTAANTATSKIADNRSSPASTATIDTSAKRPAWIYALALVPVIAIVLWLATRGGGDSATTVAETEVGEQTEVTADVAPTTAPDAAPPTSSTATDADAAAADPAPSAPAASVVPVLRLDPPTSTTLRASETLRLRASTRDPASGREVTTPIRFSSSNQSIARVNARTGDVTGVAPGRVTITADAGASGRSSVALQITAAATVATAPSQNQPTTATPPVQQQAPPPTVTTPPPAAGGGTDTPAPAPAATQAQLQSEARAVVEAYARAFESRDLGRVRGVFPGISDSWASGLSAFFEQAREVKVTINELTPNGVLSATNGSRSQLTASVTIRYNDGRRGVSQPDRWPVTLQRDGARWRLVGLGAP